MQLLKMSLAAGLLMGCSEDGTHSAEPDPVPDAAQNQVLRFDGLNDYASTGTAGFPFALAEQSMSLWFRHAGGPDQQALLVARKEHESGVQIGLKPGGVLSVWNPYGPRVFVELEGPIAAGEWHHVAYTFDGTTHRLFLDGGEVATGTQEPTNRTPSAAWLGSYDGIRQLYRGDLDDVRVWDVALTAEQVAAIAQRSGALGPSSGLVAHWTFDEAYGNRAFDRSGRGNHATLGDGVAEWVPSRVASTFND